MQKPDVPHNESERLQSLRALDILDTNPESSYDTITKLTKTFFDVPIAAISLVDTERQWFKSIQGLDVCQTTRDASFCGHTILQDELFIIENALEDDRFFDNPLVTNEPHIRFYAGYPIKGPSGYRLGTLCIIDQKPRQFSQKQLQLLIQFASLIETELLVKRKSMGYLNEIAKIQEMYISHKKPNDIFNYILDFLLKHTGSEYGFIGTILQDPQTHSPYLKTYAITNIAWNEETQKLYQDNIDQGLEFRNLDTLFGHTIKTGELVITNDPKSDPRANGIPVGHPELRTYLGMPIYGKNGLIAMYGIANRPSGYSKATTENLSAITQILTSIIDSTKSLAIIDTMTKTDQLTGTFNRFYLESYCKKIFNANENYKHAYLMIDLDFFKIVNDYHGHTAGDTLLKQFTKRLEELVPNETVIARVGGDEFVVILENIKNKVEAEMLANSIIAFSKKPYSIDNQRIFCSASIGISYFDEKSTQYADLAKGADLALYDAKNKKNSFTHYSSTLNEKFKYKIDLENKINRAFSDNAFYCLYQPQLDLKSGKIVGAEALARWPHNIPTNEFIDTIEEMKLQYKLNDYITNQVIQDLQSHHIDCERFKIAINIAFGDELNHKHILNLSKKLNSAQLPSNIVFEFEATESNVLFSSSSKNENIRTLANELKEHGITLAIDDFGIKQSSINRIIEGDFSTIKIDKCFVDRLISSQSRQANAVIKAVMSLSHDLDLTVIAEGIEQEEQLNLLQTLGVDQAQGYLLSKPISIARLSQMIHQTL